MSPSGETLVNVSYNRAGKATFYQPMGSLQPASVSYNHWGQVTKRERGNVVQYYEYDQLLRRKAIMYADNTTLKFVFKDQSMKVLMNCFNIFYLIGYNIFNLH